MINIDAILTFVFLIMPLIFAFICLYFAFYYLKNVRSMQDIPSSKIRSAAQGFVALQGSSQSLLPKPILGKLTRKPCAWFFYTIEYYKTIQTSDNSYTNQWMGIENGLCLDPFILKDGTGECVVLPQNCEMIPSSITTWRGHTQQPEPPTTSFFRWLLWDNWGRYRYSEQRLDLDIPIYAEGNFHTVDKNSSEILSNSLLTAYSQTHNTTTINILSKNNLDTQENFRVSATTPKKLSRQFKVKSLIFFIAFVFFATLTVHSSYPVVKKALQWQK